MGKPAICLVDAIAARDRVTREVVTLATDGMVDGAARTRDALKAKAGNATVSMVEMRASTSLLLIGHYDIHAGFEWGPENAISLRR